ncbi:isochorismatase family protein [Qingshengfaniella alkalisoli]|uniref:Isochorismatase family protein n=1 Tax=Qingshengfaniella alkalisoli TaxID=2599296 RepID=A0A5B8J1A5_9RHOB|nr:isochorismatase family protein [Qingshengfaniella alkalisoli]QDY70971.1 isochorismatase family protein [Qingshengfaniella alkalisoli]
MTQSRRLPTIAPYPLPRRDELPKSRASFTLDSSRAVLLIHDMQKYFCAPFETSQSPLAPVVENIAGLAAKARATGVPVFYTAQETNQIPCDRGLQADLWGPGMSDEVAHQPIIDDLAPQPQDFQLVKHRYSAFQRSNLEPMMHARGRDQIIICGIYAHIGCLLTAADAFMRDFEPFFIADALADFSRDKHDMALSYVAQVCGVPLMARDAETLL